MLSPGRVWPRNWAGLIAVLVGLASFGQQAAGQKPAGADRPANIQRAIDRGVVFLRRNQDPKDGMWHHGGEENNLGATALAGLTFLEYDVPASDPVVQQAAELVRQHCGNSTHTSSISLALMFFDRLDEEADVILIQCIAR